MSRPQTDSTTTWYAVTGVGAIGVGAAFFFADAPRFWANWLVWFLFLLSIGLGSLFIIALGHLVGAKWVVPIRRAPERLASLVLLAVPLGLIALFSLPVLYPWTQPEALHHPMVAGKAPWLNIPFFAGRVVACLALWVVSYGILVRGSFEQDRTKDPAFSVRAKKFAPAFLVVFGFTITLVAFDWISSLEPEWYSDIFGVYLFAGTFLSALAASSLVLVHLMRHGRLPRVRPDHLYNFGGFLFAFTVFWSYIGFAQYMLMWYGNMPEEIFWYKDRIEGPWLGVILLLVFVHFVLPFFALIPRVKKGDPAGLRRVSLLMLAAHWLDLYWLVFPSAGKTPVFSWPEVSFALCFVGLAILWIRRAMLQGEDMPVGDPFLEEGLEFRL